jgi:sec-independent protein translocase protein TatA
MSVAMFSGMPGWSEGLLVLFVILLLFGGKKLPSLARSLGKSLSEFKRGKQEGAQSLKEATDKDEPKKIEADDDAPAKDESAS